MTAKEIELLKQWLTCEELRLAQSVDAWFVECTFSPSSLSALRYCEAVILHEQFKRFMRSLDCLLHLYP